jgi:hypothetical protein
MCVGAKLITSVLKVLPGVLLVTSQNMYVYRVLLTHIAQLLIQHVFSNLLILLTLIMKLAFSVLLILIVLVLLMPVLLILQALKSSPVLDVLVTLTVLRLLLLVSLHQVIQLSKHVSDVLQIVLIVQLQHLHASLLRVLLVTEHALGVLVIHIVQPRILLVYLIAHCQLIEHV